MFNVDLVDFFFYFFSVLDPIGLHVDAESLRPADAEYVRCGNWWFSRFY